MAKCYGVYDSGAPPNQHSEKQSPGKKIATSHGKRAIRPSRSPVSQNLTTSRNPSLPNLGASERRKDKKSREICTIKSVKTSSSLR